jgi:hypothetical protein
MSYQPVKKSSGLSSQTSGYALLPERKSSSPQPQAQQQPKQQSKKKKSNSAVTLQSLGNDVQSKILSYLPSSKFERTVQAPKVERMYRRVEEKKTQNGVRYYWNGKLHNNGDKPAVAEKNRYEWWKEGVLHRAKGPAVISPEGVFWVRNGEAHRTDGPASIFPDGAKEWFVNGKHHNANGPSIEIPNGYKEWYIHGKLFKIETPDGETLLLNSKGKLHNINGPAIIGPYRQVWAKDGYIYMTKEGNVTRFYDNSRQLHADNGPAAVDGNNNELWATHGRVKKVVTGGIEFIFSNGRLRSAVVNGVSVVPNISDRVLCYSVESKLSNDSPFPHQLLN